MSQEKSNVTSAFDTQVGGNHYKDMNIQPMEYILHNGLGFGEGLIVKYVSRWRAKGGIEDLRKVIQVAEQMIEVEEKENCIGQNTNY